MIRRAQSRGVLLPDNGFTKGYEHFIHELFGKDVPRQLLTID